MSGPITRIGPPRPDELDEMYATTPAWEIQ
jgi:hypothetical protein